MYDLDFSNISQGLMVKFELILVDATLVAIGIALGKLMRSDHMTA